MYNFISGLSTLFHSSMCHLFFFKLQFMIIIIIVPSAPTFLPSKSSCLVRASIAVKRQHDHNNSYKGKHLIKADLQVQRFSPLSSWQKLWQLAGWHDAGEWIRVLRLYHLQTRRRERDTGTGFKPLFSLSLYLLASLRWLSKLKSFILTCSRSVFCFLFLKVDLLSVCLLIIEHHRLNYYNVNNIAKFRKLETEAWKIEIKIRKNDCFVW